MSPYDQQRVTYREMQSGFRLAARQLDNLAEAVAALALVWGGMALVAFATLF